MLDKPKNRPPRSPWRPILLIALAALCFIFAAQDAPIMTAFVALPR